MPSQKTQPVTMAMQQSTPGGGMLSSIQHAMSQPTSYFNRPSPGPAMPESMGPQSGAVSPLQPWQGGPGPMGPGVMSFGPNPHSGMGQGTPNPSSSFENFAVPRPQPGFGTSVQQSGFSPFQGNSYSSQFNNMGGPNGCGHM